jgi:hypothetical protein
MRTWRGHDEAHTVLAATAGATGHLLQLRCSQRLPAVSGAPIRDCDNYRACGKIYAGSDCGGCENRVEQPRAHHFFDDQFPGR